jgi:hypothetical protein
MLSAAIAFHFSMHEIAFADTLMYETRLFEIEVRYACNIAIDFSWYIRGFLSKRTPYLESHSVPSRWR